MGGGKQGALDEDYPHQVSAGVVDRIAGCGTGPYCIMKACVAGAGHFPGTVCVTALLGTRSNSPTG
jgi:hypothetical protein